MTFMLMLDNMGSTTQTAESGEIANHVRYGTSNKKIDAVRERLTELGVQSPFVFCQMINLASDKQYEPSASLFLEFNLLKQGLKLNELELLNIIKEISESSGIRPILTAYPLMNAVRKQ